jgi:putative transposase
LRHQSGQARLVAHVRDWPHSSFHRDVRPELFPQDWAGDVSVEGGCGERV